MSNPSNLLLSIVLLLRLVSILLAPWLSARFEPRVAALLQGGEGNPIGAVPRTLIWLALGAIFAISLFDLLARLDREGKFVGGSGMRSLRCIMKV
jgi:hypothetical protein